jgi:hypothetical protein
LFLCHVLMDFPPLSWWEPHWPIHSRGLPLSSGGVCLPLRLPF